MKGIITLCGSTRFKNEFNDTNFWLTMKGYIVLSVGSFLHSDSDPEIKDIILQHKEQLDKLHKEKIDQSSAIMVIDVNDYIGESTRGEILHAIKTGKKLFSFTRSKSTGFENLEPFYFCEECKQQVADYRCEKGTYLCDSCQGQHWRDGHTVLPLFSE